MLTLRGPQLQIRNVRVNSKHISQHPTPSLVRHFTSRSVVSITNFRSETPLLVPKPTSETFALSHRLDGSVLRKFPPVHSQLLKRGYTSQKKDDDEAAPKTETEEETKDENKTTEQDSSKVEAQGEKEKSTDEEEADSKKEEGEENGSGSESTPQLMIFKIKLTEGEDGQTKIEEVNELKPEAKEDEKAQDKTEEEAKPEEEAKKEETKVVETSPVTAVTSKSSDKGLITIGRPVTAVQSILEIPCPEKVMVLPLFKRPLFPGVNTQVHIASHDFIVELSSWQKNGGYIGMFMAKNENNGVVTDLKDIHHVGVLGRISSIEFGLPGVRQPQAIINGSYRIQVTAAEPHTSHNKLVVKVEKLKDQPYNPQDRELQAYQAELMLTLREIVSLGQTSYPQLYVDQLSSIMTTSGNRSIGDLCDVAAAAVNSASATDLQAILEATDIKQRIELVLGLLRGELEKLKLIGDIRKKLEESLLQASRQYQLKEQLKIIKKELGLEADEKQVVQDKFTKRLEGKTVPEAAMTVINEELSKLSTLDPGSSEFNVTKNYLDWLTILPWGVYSEEVLDTKKARKILDEDHFGMEDVKQRILEFIAVGKLSKGIQGKIICFVGPPGVGKTSIGKSIAKSLNREFFRFSVGGLWDTAELKGHRRTYIGAMPGKLIQAMKQVKVSNPVILIDEIDKVGRSGHHGDPTSAMLEILDPEQNKSFLDHYLDVGFDLSRTLFICTANTKDTIPGPLLDRMEVINVSGYVLEEKMNIAGKYLIPTAREQSGLKDKQVELKRDALKTLIGDYCREAGVRNLQKQIEKVFRKVALKIAEGETGKITIGQKELQKYVGKPAFNSDRYYEATPVGVVMGLAYTPLGGATLYIETIVDKLQGKPGLHKTGQMGDVMKESTDIAYSFAKSFVEEVSTGNRFFEQASLHMHIPEGATPKDGPSAGCTMTTSLLSLALNKPARKDLAMTGELTLTGKVLPIGGVKEKTIAAKRSGVKHIIFPKDNQKDFEELPKNITEGLFVHYANHYRDVYEVAFGQKVLPKVK